MNLNESEFDVEILFSLVLTSNFLFKVAFPLEKSSFVDPV
jgi:hypothetical protein